MARPLALLLLTWAVPCLSSCGERSSCSACVEATALGLHACYWCEIDQGCHAVGSALSPCTPEAAGDACISESSLSHCSKSKCGAAQDDPMRARQIHLALAGPQGMRVAWKTGGRPASASVLFSPDLTTDPGRAVPAERSVEYMPAHGYHHVATLRGLEPGTRYQYRVVCDGVTSTARTFSIPAKDLAEASFLVVADMGYGDLGQAAESRARMEALKASTDLTIHAGDIGYADDSFDHLGACAFEFCYETVYDNYMEWLENVTDGRPYMVAVGNHESECHSPACLASPEKRELLRNFTAYNARWAMPSPESGGVASMWYSFDYASVHFVVVNTETDFPGAPEADFGDSGRLLGLRAGHFAAEGAYARWLEADLAAAARRRGERPWVVAVGHRPWVYRNGTSRDKAVEKAHAALFEKYSVDLFITGHVHSYQRLLPVSGNKATPTIVTGGAGCDEFASDRKASGIIDARGRNDLWDYRLYNSDKQVGILRATPTTLSFEAIASGSGEVIDSVTLRKPAMLSV